MLIIPFGVDTPRRRLPLMNYLLILLNFYIFFEMLGPSVEAMVDLFALHTPPDDLFRPHQLLTYAFLHAGLWHIAGNMLMLWVFGGSLNARLGHVGYLLFYLGASVASGLGQVISEPGVLCVGASGAVCAVTAGYLVLYPLDRVKIFAWVIIIAGVFRVPSLMVIGLWFLLDLAGSYYGGETNVAYAAHLVGYGMGGVTVLALMALGALKRDSMDIVGWLTGRVPKGVERRRAAFSFGRIGRGAAAGGPVGPAEADDVLRAELVRAVAMGDMSAALAAYEESCAVRPGAVLPLRILVTLGNWYLRLERFPEAVETWQRAASQYPDHPIIPEILFSTGMVLSRDLGRPAEARTYLSAALPRLENLHRAQVAREEIARLGGRG